MWISQEIYVIGSGLHVENVYDGIIDLKPLPTETLQKFP